MKCRQFSWLAEELLAFRDGLCCVELITYLIGYGILRSLILREVLESTIYSIYLKPNFY